MDVPVRFAIAAVVAFAACNVPNDIDYSTKACPCPTGYTCNAQTNLCDGTSGSVGGDSGTVNDALGFDAKQGDGGAGNATCLTGAALTHPEYMSNFSDFSTAWGTFGTGSWMAGPTSLAQNNQNSGLAVAYHSVTTNGTSANYREVVTMTRIAGGRGDAIELALRIDVANESMYHCNYEPTDGSFLVQYTDQGVGATQYEVITVGLAQTVTMEFQASGMTLECCIRGMADADIVVSMPQPVYSIGPVGLKTYDMSSTFTNFELFN